jgi:hypothetical protein
MHGRKTTDRTAALLPPCFFAPAVAFFATALVLAPAVAPDLRTHFYQPHVLALVHMLTLGWISMVMMGVLYRYVPGLTKRPVPFPRLAVAQWASFVAGTTALIGGFWTGSWPTATAAAGTLATSAVLLCANLWPMLRAARRLGVAELGVGLATTALVAAAILGTLLAADKQRGFLGGDVVTNLAAHAHLAALGWVGLTVCALSFRFLPAFLLPTAEVADAARRLVALLAAAVLALVAALWWRSALTPVAALAVAAALAAYAALAARVVRTHRLPLDWTARHAIASVGWCLVTAAAGLVLCVLGGQGEHGVHLAAAYGAVGLLGWLSNLVIGVSYKLFPGFVAGTRSERARRPVPLAVLGVPERVQPAVFVAFNLGTATLAGGLLGDLVWLVVGGMLVSAAAAVLYAASTARTLAFAVLDPRRPPDPLAVLP